MRLELYRRGMRLKRWHTMEPTVQQNIGHHSAGVCSIIIELYHPVVPPARLLVAAITHDMPEATIGDIPTTVKWSNPAFANYLDKMETEWFEKHDIANPEYILADDELALLKICDLLELYIFAWEEMNRGNKEFEPVWLRVGNVLYERARTYPLDSQVKNKVLGMIDYYSRRT